MGLAVLAPTAASAQSAASPPHTAPASAGTAKSPEPRPGTGPRPATLITKSALVADEAEHAAEPTENPDRRPPLHTTKAAPKKPGAKKPGAKAACDTADFTSKTGAALVQQIKVSDTACINTLFSAGGSDARSLFREEQMITVASALRDSATNYPGNNTGSITQLVLYLRAGYYVQWGDPDTVGSYGPALQSAIRSGLDSFFGSSHAFDVSAANGETLAETVTLIDSATENARYLRVVKHLLGDYNSTYDAHWWMVAAVNNTYTVLFRGHQEPDFVTAVQSDPSVLTVLRDFAVRHDALLDTDKDYLPANAGRELARFLQHGELRSTVRPLAEQLLGRSAMTGRTASLWVGVAEMTWAYDKENCSAYGTCDLERRLYDKVLTVRHTCGPTLRIVAQELTAAELDASCTSLAGQDAYFHAMAKDSGPVADDNNTTLEVVVFDSSAQYQRYAGIIFGISTDNGGMYLEGDPAQAGNLPRFIAYEAEWLRPEFHIWNLNHEYTHYLDGRFNMYGDFAEGMRTPTVMWVEGFAEYISYGYRDVPYEKALTEAGRNTYTLSTLFDTTYENSDSTRVYQWGYLAVRYLIQSHPEDVATLLGHYRTGDWNAARTLLTSTIGTRYDADFAAWLSRCAAGDCGTNTPAPSECTSSDTRELGNDCVRSSLSATAGNYTYLYARIPEGTASLKLTVSGGTGDADLYYNPTTWATKSAHTASSTTSGNTETLTIQNPPPGYVYVSLHATEPFSGVRIASAF
ncbi:M9 family metallopeptidase [Streptomyces sp. NPDC050418]|uniref:M9 family metallopeptidase n=1 Tax=Streptomyces sp. NPDC050418 TaxID=3365612 RepID=UPI0037B58307